MPSQSRNMSEQEHSIKSRSQELFHQPVAQYEGTKATKPFRDYLRVTPAQPLSPLAKAILGVLAIIVGILFLASLWRITHPRKSRAPAPRRAAKTATARYRDPAFPSFATPSLEARIARRSSRV